MTDCTSEYKFEMPEFTPNTNIKVRKFTITNDGTVRRSQHCDDISFDGVKDPENLSEQQVQFNKELYRQTGLTGGRIATMIRNTIPERIGNKIIRPMVKVRIKDNGEFRFQLFLFDAKKVPETAMLREKYDKRPAELAQMTRYSNQVVLNSVNNDKYPWIYKGYTIHKSSDLLEKQTYPAMQSFFSELNKKLKIQHETIDTKQSEIVLMSRMGYTPTHESWTDLYKVLNQRLNFWANPDNNIKTAGHGIDAATVVGLRTILQKGSPELIHALVNFTDEKHGRPLGKILIKGDFPEDYAGYAEHGLIEKSDALSCQMTLHQIDKERISQQTEYLREYKQKIFDDNRPSIVKCSKRIRKKFLESLTYSLI